MNTAKGTSFDAYWPMEEFIDGAVFGPSSQRVGGEYLVRVIKKGNKNQYPLTGHFVGCLISESEPFCTLQNHFHTELALMNVKQTCSFI